MNKIKLGISECLIGFKVRYDGGHKLDRYLRQHLSPFVCWVPVCPEVECGLSTPREAMHLVDHPVSPRLVTIKTGIDHTDRMRKWINSKLNDLEKENLSGFVFKSKSPSSGLFGINIYDQHFRIIHKQGIGLFAKAFIDRFPLIPVEDEERLRDSQILENFMDRISLIKDGNICFKKLNSFSVKTYDPKFGS